MADLTTAQVWQEIEKELFAVVGMVSARNEARTAGIVYTVHQRKLYFGTNRHEWKTRHMAQNPNVSVTIPIAKRIPFLPWIKIPAATITFPGIAKMLENGETPAAVTEALHDGVEMTEEDQAASVIFEITPQKQFITYGVGVSLQTMRDTEKARGRVAVR